MERFRTSPLAALVILLLACLSSLSCPRSFGALLSHESFAYPLNAGLPGQNGGEGFAGAWVAGVNAGVASSRFQVISPSLSYPGLGGEGARLRVTSGTAQGARRLLSQPMGTDGTVRYMSLLVRPDATPSASSYFGLQLLGSAGADLFAGKPGGGATQRYVLENAGGAGQVATTRNVTANEVVLLVLRLEFNAGNDRISLYVNPALGATEPAVADAVKTDLNLGTTVVPALTGPAAWSADELRVGTTFADVTPPAPDFQLRPVQTGNVTEHISVTRQVETVVPLPPGRTLTFALVGETYGAQIDSVTGAFSWVPGEREGSQRRTFTIRATSNVNPPASATVSFFLDVIEGNFAPQLEFIADQSVKEGSEFTYQLVATDSDEPRQNLFFAIQAGPPGLTTNSTPVQLYWRPTWAQRGRSYPVTVLVGDTMSGRASRSFTITVQARNHFTARWTGGASGAWDVPGNWDIGQVPHNSVDNVFDVQLSSGSQTAAIHVPGDVTIHDLSWTTGGSIELQSPSGLLSVEGNLTWAGGALAGPGQMTVHGRATIGGNQGGLLTLRDQARLVLKAQSELSSPMRCEGNVRVVVEATASLGVPQYGGFVRVGGVPELHNHGRISIWGQQQPIPFIYLYNLGTVFTYASTLDFDTNVLIAVLQEPGGHLSIGAGFDQGGTINGYALIRQGSTVFGQGYIHHARVEGRIQGRFNFEQLEFGPTAVSKFNLTGMPDRLSATQPIALDGQMELAMIGNFSPEPDQVFPIVQSAGPITGQFAGRPLGQRVQVPGTGQSLLLTRSADAHSVELRRYLPPSVSLTVAPLSFRMAEFGGGLGGCYIAPDPAILLPEATLAGSSLTVAITDGYDAAVDRLEFRPNPAFPEADAITFEGPLGSVQTVRFRGTDFGTVQLSGGLMTCVLNAQADNEAAVALLGRLRYENTELTADWFTRPDMNYPQRTIVVTLTDALGATEVSRWVNFPFLWGLRLPSSVELPNGAEKELELLGWFSTGQVLPVRKMVTTWDDGACSVLMAANAEFPGRRSIKGQADVNCCLVVAESGNMQAATATYETYTRRVNIDEIVGELALPPLTRLFFELFGEGLAYASLPPRNCSLIQQMLTITTYPCETTPAGRQALPGNLTSLQPPTPFYALESLMQDTAAGRRLTELYRTHGAEVVRLFLAQPRLLVQAQQLVSAYQPGVVALLAGRGDTVPIYIPMITQVNDFWNALAEHASPALKAVLQQEQARFDNFRMFQNRTFNEWAGLLGIHVPFQPYLHISLMHREATKFHVALNDIPGVNLSLWRSLDLLTWTQVTNAEIQRDGTTLIFTDPTPPAGQAFYNVRP